MIPLMKFTFMNEVDPNVIIRVVGEINQIVTENTEIDMEKIEKN